MMQSLLILGRQPKLGLAELLSLYGEDKLVTFTGQAAIIDIDPCNFRFDRLGGSIKFCKLLTTLDTTDINEVIDFLCDVSPSKTELMPEGKMNLGLSLYGFNSTSKDILQFAFKLKKSIKTTGRGVRIVPNKEPALNTAQVIYNKLTNPKSWELVIVKDNGKTHIAQTVKVQDIGAYSARDQNRPFRDARVGMLPPKLAQIIINLAVGPLSLENLSSICDDNNAFEDSFEQIILDPFCGTGVVLQEAAFMGYKIAGSDINGRMIEYSQGNLNWLKDKKRLNDLDMSNLKIADAMDGSWENIDFVAAETNLGKPLSSIPNSSELKQITDGANNIIKNFLLNIQPQLKPGARLCLGIPAWQVHKDSFINLPLIDQIEDLGYNLVDFKNISNEELIYYRANQVVARQLLVITRI